MPDKQEDRIAALEAKVQELDALVNLTLRLLAVAKPVASLLDRLRCDRVGGSGDSRVAG